MATAYDNKDLIAKAFGYLQEDVPQSLQKKHIALIFLIRDKKSNPVNTLLNY